MKRLNITDNYFVAKGGRKMRLYHGTQIKEGRNIEIDGFLPSCSDNCMEEEHMEGMFFTDNFKYASLYAGNSGEVWYLDTDIPEHIEIINSIQLYKNYCTNPDWTGYFEEEEEVNEYIVNWNIIIGFIPMTTDGDFCVLEPEV